MAWLLVVALIAVSAFLILAQRKVRTLRRRQARLELLAYRDGLTGLESRAGLIGRAQTMLDAGTELTFLYLDLDGFKPVNDSFGHDAGDTVLVEVTKRLRESVGDSGMLGRLGGDEFAVILAGPFRASQAEGLAKVILNALTKPFVINGTEVIITLSIGIAYSRSATSAEDLVRDADLAMYAAKGRGKATWAVYEAPMRAGVAHTFGLEAELRSTILDASSEVEVAYQPLLELKSGNLVAAEVLARWTTGSAGTVGPSEFVPLAERTSLIHELGRQVLRTACVAAASWNVTGVQRSVWVNVSRSQVVAPAFHDQVSEVLAEAGLDPQLLVLEVTESAWTDLDRLVAPLTALRRLGVGLAIDDFGAGVSSLSCLWRIPISAVKIDKALIDGIGVDRTLEVVAESIIDLGGRLGITVAAEGVESEEQLDFLRSVGCELAQGFLVAEPMSQAAVADLLRQ